MAILRHPAGGRASVMDAKAQRLKDAKDRLAKFKTKSKKKFDPASEDTPTKKPPAVAAKKVPPPVAAKPKTPPAVSTPPAVKGPPQSSPPSTSADEYDENLSYEERRRLRKEARKRAKDGDSPPVTPTAAATAPKRASPPVADKPKKVPPAVKPKPASPPVAAKPKKASPPVAAKPVPKVAVAPSPLKAKPGVAPAGTAPLASGPSHDELFDTISKMSLEVKGYEAQLDTLKGELKAATDAKDKAQAELKKGAAAAPADAGSDELYDTISKMSVEIKDYEAQVQALKGQLEDSPAATTVAPAASDQSGKLAVLEAEVAGIAGLTAERDQLVKDCEAQEGKLTELMNTMKAEVQKAEEKGDMENEKKTVHIRRLEIEGKVDKEEIAKLRKQIEGLQTHRVKNEEQIGTIGELKAANDELKAANEELNLQRENATLLQSSRESEAEMQALEQELAAKKHASELADLSSQLAALRESTISKEESKKQVDAAFNKGASASAADFEKVQGATLKSRDTEVAALNAEVASLKAAATDANATAGTLKNLEAQLKDAKAEYKKKEAAALEELNALRCEFPDKEELEADLEEALRGEIIELHETLEKRQDALKFAIQASHDAEAELDEAHAKIDELCAAKASKPQAPPRDYGDSGAASKNELEEALAKIETLESHIRRLAVAKRDAQPTAMQATAAERLGISAQVHHRTLDIARSEGGLGMKMSQDEQYVFVEALKPGGVAESSGLVVGDVILQAGRTSTKGMAMKEVMALVIGAEGSEFRLVVAQRSEFEKAGVAAQVTADGAEDVVQQWSDEVDRLNTLVDVLTKENDALKADLESAETSNVQMKLDEAEWRERGGTIELPDDAKDEVHARALMELQDDLANAKQGERDAKLEIENMKQEAQEVRLLHDSNIKQLKEANADAAAEAKGLLDLKAGELTKTHEVVEHQQREVDRLRGEISAMTSLFEKEKSMNQPFGELEGDITGESSVEELRAVLTTSMYAREVERRDHAKVISSLGEQHTSLVAQIDEWRAVDAHIMEMVAREDRIRLLLAEAKGIQTEREDRGFTTATKGKRSRKLPPSRGAAGSSRPASAMRPTSRTRGGGGSSPTTPAGRPKSTARKVARSKANTALRLAGLRPMKEAGSVSPTELGVPSDYLGYYDRMNPNESYAVDASMMEPGTPDGSMTRI